MRWRRTTIRIHAGLAQEFKAAGIPLLVVDVQIAAIPELGRIAKPRDGYVRVTMHGNVMISCADSRPTLERIGIAGRIVHTPGHSDDSVSLVLDTGAAFTGDLTLPSFSTVEAKDTVLASWRLLKEAGARQIYPGHGRVWQMHA